MNVSVCIPVSIPLFRALRNFFGQERHRPPKSGGAHTPMELAKSEVANAGNGVRFGVSLFLSLFYCLSSWFLFASSSTRELVHRLGSIISFCLVLRITCISCCGLTHYFFYCTFLTKQAGICCHMIVMIYTFLYSNVSALSILNVPQKIYY